MKSDKDNKDAKGSPLTEIMLEFVRAAVLERDPIIPSEVVIDWDKLMDMAHEHGILAWVWDGICRMPQEQQPPRQQRINWGLSAQEIWIWFDYQKKILKEIVSMCNQNGIRLLLLKGIGLSELFPKPMSRFSNDIDIFLFGEFEKGNKVLSGDNYYFDGKHASFSFRGVLIENHYTISDNKTKNQRIIEDIINSKLDEILLSDIGYYTLSNEMNIVYLMIHTLFHFDDVHAISFRNIFDFAYFLHKKKYDVRVNLLKDVLNNVHMEKSFVLLLSLSERVLGVPLHEYYMDESIPKEDLNMAYEYVSNRIKKPVYTIDSYSLSGILKYLRWCKNERWLFKYLPASRGEHISFFLYNNVAILFHKIFRVKSNIHISPWSRQNCDTPQNLDH